MKDGSTELINFGEVLRVMVNSSDSDKTDLIMTNATTQTIDCELSILTPFLIPLLVKEDLAGNPL